MHRQRNVLGEATRSTGRRLFEAALAGGAQATEAPTTGGISPGKRADFVVLDHHHPALAAAQGDSLLDAWLFAADNAAIKTVYCRGVPVVRERPPCRPRGAQPALSQGLERAWPERLRWGRATPVARLLPREDAPLEWRAPGHEC